jgi:fatty acid-binding protein DegV
MTNDEIEKLRQGKKEAAAYMLEKLKQQSLLKEQEIQTLKEDKQNSIKTGKEYIQKNIPKKDIQ